MSKEVQMTIRIEPELRDAFSDAVKLEDRPAAQVLREFMRAYVNKSRERAIKPANDPISATERRRRQEAVDSARASIGLEGFKPGRAAELASIRYVNGEISMAEFMQVKPDAENAAGN